MNILQNRVTGASFNEIHRQPYLKPRQTERTPLTIGQREVFTAAQAMTLIAYGDNNENNLPVRSLDYKVKCDDYADLAACLQIIREYNEFDAALILKKAFFKLNIPHFLNENNPNNGKNLFDFWIAREGSPAFYVSHNDHFNNKRITDTEEVPATETEPAKTLIFWEEYTAEDFRANMEYLAQEIKADEFTIKEFNYKMGGIEITHRTARFWFD